MSVHPRVAIITGGGRGIGRAMALGLAEAGARVIVSAARERDEIEAVADEALRRFGERRIVAEPADVSREDDCARLVAVALHRFGRLVTVNALLPGGATLTGMIPDSVSPELKAKFIDPAIMAPPLVWLASERSDGVAGRRFVATRWRADLPEAEAALAAADDAGWTTEGVGKGRLPAPPRRDRRSPCP